MNHYLHMFDNRKLPVIIFILTFSIILLHNLNSVAGSGGRTGRTLKTSTAGCSCHGTRDTISSVMITGPNKVAAGSTNTYRMIIYRPPQTGAGCDIAARTGILSPVSSFIRLSGNELTHNYNLPLTGNSIEIFFNYTAPLLNTIDTIFATGNATNSNGNSSGDIWNWAPSFRVDVVMPKVLSLNVLIEGFYNPVTGFFTEDTVNVFIRTVSSPYTIMDSCKSKLNSSGSAYFNFVNAENGMPYYLEVNHRNSIQTWSSGGNLFFSDSLSYDFTLSSSQAYGNNLKHSGTKWVIFGGDVNKDGIVDASDVTIIENDAANYASGYLQSDLTGDEITDASDMAIADNNASEYVSVILP